MLTSKEHNGESEVAGEGNLSQRVGRGEDSDQARYVGEQSSQTLFHSDSSLRAYQELEGL